jgi:hypothetical protein
MPQAVKGADIVIRKPFVRSEQFARVEEHLKKRWRKLIIASAKSGGSSNPSFKKDYGAYVRAYETSKDFTECDSAIHDQISEKLTQYVEREKKLGKRK